MSTNSADVATPDPGSGLVLVLPGRGTGAGAGWDWVVEGWGLFTRAPLMWIISIVVLVVAAIAVSLVPIVGSLAFQVLQPVFTAGFMAGCRALEKNGEFEIEHLLAGFTRRFVPLMVVGLITVAGWIAILLVFVSFVGLSILGAVLTGDTGAMVNAIAASAMALALGTLVCLALMVPLMAAYWFAPALVMLNGMAPLAAMKASFFACLRNFVPFLVYGLVMLVAAIIAMIPFGLGMLVWVPLAIASTYAAYRQIFTEPDAQGRPE